METSNERWKEKGKAKKTERAFYITAMSNAESFDSLPPELVYIRMSRVAGDAFNAAVGDDTDMMRQTAGWTVRREGREALSLQTTYGLTLGR